MIPRMVFGLFRDERKSKEEKEEEEEEDEEPGTKAMMIL